MVFGGDFKVALVDAQTKQTFPEHYRDGQAYVEVEPDVEYYISLQRIQSSLGGVIVTCKVDGKDLGWQRNYQFNEIDTQPHYNGSSTFSYSNADPTGYYRNQEEKRTALVFAKAKFRIASSCRGGGEGEAATSTTATATTVVPMGKVEFNVFQMGNPFTLMGCDNLFISDIAAKSDEEGKDPETLATVVSMTDIAANKKQVRSGLGTHTGDTVVESGNGVRLYGHSKGQLLQTITLNYSTVPGLISAGVLSKVEADFQRSNTAAVTDPTKVMMLASQQVQQLNQQFPSNSGGNRVPQQHIYGYQPDPSMSFAGLRNAFSFQQEQFQQGQASLAAPFPQAVVSAPLGGGRVSPPMITSGGTTHQQNNSMMLQAPAGGVHGGDGGNDPLLLLNSVQGAYGRESAAPSNHQLQQQHQQQGGNGYHHHHHYYPQNCWYPQQYGRGRSGGHMDAAGGQQQQGHGGGGY